MKHRGKTHPFRGPDGRVLPNSIAETAYVRLGGVDQWVMIRGERRSNPVLAEKLLEIVLHGRGVDVLQLQRYGDEFVGATFGKFVFNGDESELPLNLKLYNGGYEF